MIDKRIVLSCMVAILLMGLIGGIIAAVLKRAASA